MDYITLPGVNGGCRDCLRIKGRKEEGRGKKGSWGVGVGWGVERSGQSAKDNEGVG